MVWQRYHLVHVVLIFSRNPQKILPNHFHAQFWDGFRAFWLAPGMKFVHLICPFTCIRTCVHLRTYAYNVQTNTKPVPVYRRACIGKNVRWLAPFGNMEYLICPFQSHMPVHVHLVMFICCTMYILPPDWPPGLSIALWFAHMCICSTRSPLEHWSGLLKYYKQSCKPWNNYWFEFNR